MNSLDLVVLCVLAGSAALGLMRGLVKEVFSLAAWVLAFLGARLFGPWVATLLPSMENPALRHAAALVLVFVTVLLGAALAGSLLSGLVRMAGLEAYDRVLGGVFGLARAGIALVALTVVAGLTALPQTQAWKHAWSRGPLERVARQVIPWLPRDVSALIKYS